MRQTAVIVLTLITFGLSACTRNNNAPKQGDNPQTEKVAKTEVKKVTEGKDKKMNVTEMTAEMFKAKIMDYEKNPKEWIYKGTKPAIIDFYATWCGPCKATAPILDDLAGVYADQIDVYKVDVDQQPELASFFGIRSIPSLLFIPQKGDPQMQVGAMNRPQLEEAIKTVLLK